MTMTKREGAYHELVKLLGASETTGPNRGPVIDKIEADDNLAGNGYSYCQSTQSYTWHAANDELLAGGTASVWAFADWCRSRGYAVGSGKPQAYDHVTYDFGEGSGGPYDHVGQIEKVISLGPLVVIRTLEGNTSSTDAGSQSNGGGIYRKTRTVLRSRVAFFRVPGDCPNAKRYEPVPAAVALLRAKTGEFAWRQWYLGEDNWKAYKPKDPNVRPNVPATIPTAWWSGLNDLLELRKKKAKA